MTEVAARGSRVPIFLTAILAVFAAWPIATLIVGDPFDRSPRYALVPVSESEAPVFTVPPFELVDQRGAPFGSAQLNGKVWVATFFFTSCPSICPRLMDRAQVLAKARDEAGLAFEMVTFTVDPETDTPEVLAAHAKKRRIDTAHWTFLTGEPGKLEATIVEGFKQAMGTSEPAPSDTVEDQALDIAHGVRFVLVDAQGGVRGLYDTDDDGVAEVLGDARALIAQEKTP